MKIFSTSIIAIFLLTGSAWACEFHDGFGFGAHRFGAPPQIAVAPKPDLKLTVPAMIKATDSPKVSTQIAFDRPDEVQEAKLEVVGSNKLTFSSENTVALTDSTGTIPLEFEILEPGYHLLTVKVTGIAEGEPVSYSRRVIVRM